MDASSRPRSVQEVFGTPPQTFGARPVRVREEPRDANKIEHEHYMEKLDSWMFPALRRVEDPTVGDFERAFHKFEHDYFEDDDGFLQMAIDATTPQHTRMVMASARFLK